MSILNPHWLKDYYKSWTDDDLHDRYREVCVFDGPPTEKLMLEMESKRREEEYSSRGCDCK